MRTSLLRIASHRSNRDPAKVVIGAKTKAAIRAKTSPADPETDISDRVHSTARSHPCGCSRPVIFPPTRQTASLLFLFSQNSTEALGHAVSSWDLSLRNLANLVCGQTCNCSPDVGNKFWVRGRSFDRKGDATFAAACSCDL